MTERPPRSVCWITNSKDAEYATAPIEQLARNRTGHPTILEHLAKFGWDHTRLGFWQSLTPRRVAKYITAASPDLIYTYGGITSLQPILARDRYTAWRGPIVHGWDDNYDEIWRDNFGWLAGRFMRSLQERVIGRSDYVITISLSNKHRAEAMGKRAWYVPNGCEVPEYSLDDSSVKLKGDLKLLYLGDQARYKRTHEVVRAMSKLPKGIKLYLVGRPYPHLQKYKSDNVIFLGPKYGRDKWAIMAQADVLVSTADQDCNLRFHEYLRMRKPILTYDGNPNWFFKNGHNALLTRDYATAIMELYHSPELRARLAANAVREIPVYTWREVARKTAEAFDEILGLYDGDKKGLTSAVPKTKARFR